MNSKQMSIIWLSIWTIILSAFIYHLYFQKHFKAVISITEVPHQKLRILDKDGIYQEFDSDIVWNYFKTLNVYRNWRLESIGI